MTGEWSISRCRPDSVFQTPRLLNKTTLAFLSPLMSHKLLARLGITPGRPICQPAIIRDACPMSPNELVTTSCQPPTTFNLTVLPWCLFFFAYASFIILISILQCCLNVRCKSGGCPWCSASHFPFFAIMAIVLLNAQKNLHCPLLIELKKKFSGTPMLVLS